MWWLALSLAAAADRDALVEWEQEGTRVVMVADDRAPLVFVTLRLPIGASSRWFEAHHGAEALRFTDDDPGGALRQRASALAVDVSISAGSTWSQIQLWCLAEDWPAAAELLGDVLRNDDYDRRALSRARRTDRLAWAERRDSPRHWQWRAAAEALFGPDDPRAWPYRQGDRLSRDADALAATRDRIVALPGRVVGVAGDLPEEAVRAFVSALPPIRDDVPDGVEPVYGALPERPERQRVGLPRLTQVYFSLYRDSLTIDDPDRAALIVAEHVLGGHFWSRLYVAMRHDTGHTYGVGSSAQATDVPGIHAITTFTRVDNADAAERTLLETLRTFARDGITEQERAEAVRTLQGRRAFARMSPNQLLSERLGELAHGLEPDHRERLVQRAAALTLDEINAVIARHYDPERFTLLRVEPDGSYGPTTEEQ